MIKLLIGGSPCTYWSIAQKNNRETQAEGLGWELFKNYLIAKEKFKPDFFLAENIRENPVFKATIGAILTPILTIDSTHFEELKGKTLRQILQ